MSDRKEIQALHAAISHRDWHAVEIAANVLRDQDARPTPSRAQALEDEIVKHANKTVTLGGQNYKAILLEDVLSVVRAFSSLSMDVTFPQHEEEPTKWQWWGGRDEEWFTIGPCESKEEVIQLAIDERVGEFFSDDGKWYVAVHVIEAQQEPVKLSDYILDADRLLQSAEESLAESDRASAEYDEGPYFDATGDQISDLDKRTRLACDEWQHSHGLKFVPSTFSASRNREHVVAEIPTSTEVSS
ncbi:hypothetical protein CES85_1036 [Ochrobactrum quorumnocens]|uniref:Uncharacterized protein n=1 Tax=Ochrobactrum quorumnocens TaxID=271865 RepID=A0A248UI24_9HYPH|nr:hypothetical protein [[Ochrobactrum] quorumnocens]ASV86493.1 hypothetical protein CES85_1036 [[Ochrobactrum] quorumnocens]